MEKERSILEELIEYLFGYQRAIFLIIDDLKTDSKLVFSITLK